MLFGKKAAGDAISALILFVAVVGVSTGLVIAMKNYAFDTQDSFNTQSEILSSQLRTAIDITNVFYNSTENRTYVYLKNIGDTKLVTEDFDFFIDDAFISDFNVTEADNFSVNMTVLLVSETAAFSAVKFLEAGSHEVKLVSGYGGNGDTDYFNN